ncbi:asparagine synthase [Inmirania thermothiophila]|uniref:Asparagine synthase n=1 Tax=Inmirania thermothiophila TaxID=1750597 RepID=A0A3N1XSK1_9GAMM|nr:asparagine synthase [Inmirania thermothiophila]
MANHLSTTHDTVLLACIDCKSALKLRTHLAIAGYVPPLTLRAERTLWREASAGALVDRMMALDLRITLADNDLRKVRHMAEAAGVRARFPMLDAAVLELAHRIPPRLHLAGGRLRAFYKDAFAGFLPPEVLAKPKHGFGLPFGHWLNTDPDLGTLARDHLEALGRRGIVRAAWIQRLLAGNRDHPNYYGEMLWVLVMLEAWLRRAEAPR